MGCFFGGFKTAEVDIFFPVMDYGAPPVSNFGYAFVSTGIVGSKSSIARILSGCGFSQIFSAVVERVVVFVVPFFTWSTTEDFPCHVQNRSFFAVYTLGAHRVETAGFVIPLGAPIPLVEPRIISGIDH